MVLSDICCGTPEGPTSICAKVPFLPNHFFVTDRSHGCCWREKRSQNVSPQKAKYIAQRALHAHV